MNLKEELDKIDYYYSYHTTLILEITTANNYFWNIQRDQIKEFGDYNAYLKTIDMKKDKFEKLGHTLFEKVDLVSEHYLKMGLIYLFSLFEAFNKDFFQKLFLYRPDLMKSKNKSLNYEILLNFSNISELHEFITRKEVETFGYFDIDNMSKLLIENFNINLENDFDHWHNLRENYYRRNIVVHNEGRISSVYLKKLDLPEERLNDELKCDFKYIGESCYNIQGYMNFVSESIREKFGIEPLI